MEANCEEKSKNIAKSQGVNDNVEKNSNTILSVTEVHTIKIILGKENHSMKIYLTIWSIVRKIIH